MDEENRDNPIEALYDHLTELEWPNLQKTDDRLFIRREEEITILERSNNKYILSFVYFNRRADEYGQRSGLKAFRFDASTNISELVSFSRRGYNLKFEPSVRSILLLNNGEANEATETLDVSASHQRFSVSGRHKLVKVPLQKFQDILEDAKDVYRRGESYKDAIQRHLINKYVKKHLGKETQRTTTIRKGEFNFLVNRLNLNTKRKTEDYKRFLDKADIQSLQDLSLELIDKEVFDLEFLRKLDDYFIKEKLQRIIELGRSILDLKSQKLDTQQATKVLDELKDEQKKRKKIKQLETLWQRFFEKYLLYLIFSYKEIYPKIELKLEGDKKYPDFIGINHYYGVDAIEIKTHLAPALTWDGSHENFSFSPELSKAIIQTTNYMDAIKQERFKDDDDRDKITQTTYEENLYRPRGIIIISSNDRLVRNQSRRDQGKIRRDFTKLRNSLHNIEILTFDEILDIADHYTKNIVVSHEASD